MAGVLLACDCVVPFREGMTGLCPTHGAQRIARTVGMRAPSFRGAVKPGPVSVPEDLPPFVGRLPGLSDGDESPKE